MSLDILSGTIIDHKPVTIVTDRNPTTDVRVRIETWVAKSRVRQLNENMTTVFDAILLFPLTADIAPFDRFQYDGRHYEVLHVLPETILGGIKQATLILRD